MRATDERGRGDKGMKRPIYYRPKIMKQYPKGRVCGGEGCSAVLSIYNPDHVCAKCDESMMPV